MRAKRFWEGDGGGREVLAVAYPLILGQMSFTVQVFVDRLFLTWYSAEAVAGAVTGLFAVWALIGLCIGTGEYLTTFVAQYVGARRPERIGPALWQGIYFSLAAGAILALLAPLAGPAFALAGHETRVQAYEVTFASILLLGSTPVILMATLSAFFAGRGNTRVILVVNVAATAVNCLFDYAWIFGKLGFPSWGVAGAAWSTVTSQVVGSVILLLLILKREHRRVYRTLAGWRFEPALFGRFLRFGLPTGLQYSLEIGAFALFMVLVGRIGTVELAASGIAFNLNMIVFMPMLGLGVGVSAVAGRHLGAGRIEAAERTPWSAFWMSLVYMSLCGLLYLAAPGLLLAPYAAGADPATFPAVAKVATVLLRFIALYSIFDMMNVVFAAGLKGAGDTLYPLLLTLLLSWGAMLVPAYVACELLGGGAYVAWSTATAYVVLLGLLLLRRFRTGRWKKMRVIEGAADPSALVELAPTAP
jgi:MATE family multidrug resistance protein